MKTLVRTVAFLLFCGLAFGQQPAGKLEFEVASIKPAEPQPMGLMKMMAGTDAGMARFLGLPLSDLVRRAYRLKDFQVEGPDWMSNTRFDIVAKLPEGAKEDQVPEMLQALLADRFKMTFHRDTKEHAIYALVAGKDGAKLKESEIQTPDPAQPQGTPGGGAPPAAGSSNTSVSRPLGPGERLPALSPNGPAPKGGVMFSMSPEGMHMKANGMTIPNLADMLSRFTERPIVDMTGIKGRYDFDLAFMPETTKGMMRMPAAGPGGERPAGTEASEPGASIFEAVAHYGLKLEPRKAPMEILTIDHIEKTPTEN